MSMCVSCVLPPVLSGRFNFATGVPWGVGQFKERRIWGSDGLEAVSGEGFADGDEGARRRMDNPQQGVSQHCGACGALPVSRLQTAQRLNSLH